MSGSATLWNLMPGKHVSQVVLMCRLYVQKLIGRGIEKVFFFKCSILHGVRRNLPANWIQ